MLCYRCKQSLNSREPQHEGLHETCFVNWFGSPLFFNNIIPKNFSSAATLTNKQNSSFFHGKFRKYSGSLGKKNYILKVEQRDYPELPRFEYLCNQIAVLLKIKVPPFFLIRFQNELDAFVSQNFMQSFSSSSLIHIYHFIGHQEFSCETIAKIIEEKTQSLKEVEKFIQITLFDALIGNHDRHGRNLALIQSPKGFQLAPAYDNPSYIAIELESLLGAIHEPKGSIATKETSEPSLNDYIKEWKRLNYMYAIENFKKQIFKKEKMLFDLISSSFICSKRQQAFTSLIQRRLGELK
ncbi:MAG: HipA domain-containing protein [Parachlamydiales bacterium]|nr:HipA domain-containing protein [Parachlamydiales bacterium]